MNELVFEIYSEEIPAKLQLFAVQQLEKMIKEKFVELGLSFLESEFFVSPRRVSAYVNGVEEYLPEKTIDKKGPKVGASQDVIANFAKANGVSSDDLIILDVKGIDYYFVQTVIPPQKTKDVIALVLPDIISNFPWPKSMRWSESKLRWIRPIRNIMCIFNSEIVDFEVGGIKSNNVTFGHRFMSYKSIVVSSYEQYKADLRAHKVVYDHEERKAIIIEQLQKISQQNDLEIIEDVSLLQEVSGLVEYPVAVIGGVDERFMHLPPEVIITSMKNHQKYFCCRKNNILAPFFITILNVDLKSEKPIEGNQKVLSARLEDAVFFWQQDLQKGIDFFIDKLKYVTFHHKLGSVYEKNVRIEKIANFISDSTYKLDYLVTKRASQIIKFDLVTDMVGEFPELQGVIGSYYALQHGESPVVATAIKEHYNPVNAHDEPPVEALSVVMALADRVDSLVGLWAVGEKPTGSKDHFALRRNVIAIIKIIEKNNLGIDLGLLLTFVYQIYEEKCSSKVLVHEIMEFVQGRLEVYLSSNGCDLSIIRAVKDNSDNIGTYIQKTKDLSEFCKSNDGTVVTASCKRLFNLLASVKNLDESASDGFKTELVKDDVETKLYEEYKKSAVIMGGEESYLAKLRALVDLAQLLDKTLDKVQVFSDDKVHSCNILRLLMDIRSCLITVTDFSLL